jgi:Na+-translocating ferredoxin:NAD+ oxidoreductase RNF subunit RnfB
MIIEKKVDPILHRQKCKQCGYYTVYQAVPAGEKAIDACTHCGYAVQIEWNHDIKAAFKNMEKFLRNLEEIYPELKGLKNPGDHIMLD